MAAAASAALLTGTLFAQPVCPPQLRWQQSFGTPSSENARVVLQTADGGFLIAGESQGAAGEGNKTGQQYGGGDIWLVRLDAQGQKLWDRSYGGSNSDQLGDIDHDGNGGFILGAISYSAMGGNKTSPYYGLTDFWVVRIDSQGNVLWNRSFGGSGFDWCNTVHRTADGGFIVAGSTESPANGNKTAPPRGGADCWVVRLDANGEKLWEGSFGGASHDYLNDIRQAADGGFVFGGYSMSVSNQHKSAPSYGNFDYWLVRLDASGNKLWDRSYGGTDYEVLRRVLVAPNGDLLLAGNSRSDTNGTKTVPNFSYENFWVLRLNANGNEIWQRVYGGERGSELEDAAPSGDGFLLAGWSDSAPSGNKTSPSLGGSDYWIVRIDGQGNPIWDGSFGGTFHDVAYTAVPTVDGGYIAAGVSDSVNGHNTGPHFGGSDMWVVRLNPENTADCDNDGVLNAQDLCNETLFGALVNTNGCSVDQICPCDGWLLHSEYFDCVERVSAEFESAGAITSAQRAELLARAETANCPRTRVLYGLRHVLHTDTVVDEYGHFVPGTNPVYGASILLGEADSGIFIDPGAGGWGSYDSSWYLEGKAYGRFTDGSNSLIGTVRATKPYLETYPVEIDFTPLNPTRLTLQFFTNGVKASEEATDGPIGSFTVNSAEYLAPRVNPFCRMPDGSVGALFEFHPEFGQYPFDRIFVRVDNPGRQVEHVWRVDATSGRDLYHFSFLDERLGMFGNRHRIAGSGVFEAAEGQLTIRKGDHSEDYWIGTTIEFPNASHAEVDFVPIDLTTHETGLRINGFSLCEDPELPPYPCEIAALELGLLNAERLGLRANFSSWFEEAIVEIQVFRDGALAGTRLAGSGDYLLLTNQHPKMTACTFTASSNAPPSISFAVDQLSILVCTTGEQISGTHFRMTPTNAVEFPHGVSSMSVVLPDPGPAPAFTILDERSASARPRLSIASTETEIVLAWRDNTRLFQLESSPSLPGGFTPVSGEVAFIDGHNRITLPRESTGSRFFRVRSSVQ